MTPLRKRMIEDLRIRDLSRHTIRAYVRHVARYAEYHGRSPEELGLEEVRAYPLHLIEEGRSWSGFNQAACAIRFLYRVTLRKPWWIEHLPYGKKPRRLPVVLSQEEIRRVLAAVASPVSRLALTTAYAAGLRVSEVAALRVEDIDSTRMPLATPTSSSTSKWTLATPTSSSTSKWSAKPAAAERARSAASNAARGPMPASLTTTRRLVHHAIAPGPSWSGASLWITMENQRRRSPLTGLGR